MYYIPHIHAVQPQRTSEGKMVSSCSISLATQIYFTSKERETKKRINVNQLYAKKKIGNNRAKFNIQYDHINCPTCYFVCAMALTISMRLNNNH